MNWRVIEVCPDTGDEAIIYETPWRSDAVAVAEAYAEQSSMFGVKYRVTRLTRGRRG